MPSLQSGVLPINMAQFDHFNDHSNDYSNDHSHGAPQSSFQMTAPMLPPDMSVDTASSYSSYGAVHGALPSTSSLRYNPMTSWDMQSVGVYNGSPSCAPLTNMANNGNYGCDSIATMETLGLFSSLTNGHHERHESSPTTMNGHRMSSPPTDNGQHHVSSSSSSSSTTLFETSQGVASSQSLAQCSC